MESENETGLAGAKVIWMSSRRVIDVLAEFRVLGITSHILV